MNQETLKKHLMAVEGSLANTVITLLKNTLAEAHAKIEELEARIKELDKDTVPKQEPPAS